MRDIIEENDPQAFVMRYKDEKTITSQLPNPLKMLCMWGDEGFKDGKTITVQIEAEVFGNAVKTHILEAFVHRLATMEALSGNVIVVYKTMDMFSLVDHGMIGDDGCGGKDARSAHICDRMLPAKPGQILLLPYNWNKH